MHIISRYLLTLVALFALSMGAWAQTMLQTPLTLEATADGKISVSKPVSGMQYSLNGGTKAEVPGEIAVKANDIVQFFGDGDNITSYFVSATNITQINCNVDCYIYGNIMSLVSETGFASATELTGSSNFYGLFYCNDHLINHPTKELVLPATTLTSDCYYGMFDGCAGLTTAPELPATVLATSCYEMMFNKCTGLTTAPELPAMKLASGCYANMFQDCANLTASPVLPAPKLVGGCYAAMFYGCTNLSEVTCLATDISAANATNNWLENVATTGTFTKAPSTVWPAGEDGIPSGWTSEEFDFTAVQVEMNEGNTEFSFKMPMADVVECKYELVRDMSIDVTTFIRNRIRIKKDGEAFVAAYSDQIYPMVRDNLNSVFGTAMSRGDANDYTLQLQKKNDDGGYDDVTALSVGTFRYKVTGVNDYDGDIYTSDFQLYQGYEIEVPAGEMVTYYWNERLYVDSEESSYASIYTITDVEGDKAYATKLNVARAFTPLIIFNGSTTESTVLLIPSEYGEVIDGSPVVADDVTVYDGFRGTMSATTIAASTSVQDNYALNGQKFVYVKNALGVKANKAWLEVPKSAGSARSITIVFDSEATGIDKLNADGGTLSGDWYTLDGRKLDTAPTRKGIYILNGHKVVVK